MSLTANDLECIREIVRDECRPLENDIKEIYRVLARMDRNIRLSNKNTIAIGRHIGVSLPHKLKF